MDPFIGSARYALKQSIEDYRRSLSGLETGALNWKPAGDDTNSMAVLLQAFREQHRHWRGR